MVQDGVADGGTNTDVDGQGVSQIWQKRRYVAKREPIGQGGRRGRMEREGQGGQCDGSWWVRKVGSEDNVEGWV